MRNATICAVGLSLAMSTWACRREPPVHALEIPAGTQVTLQKTDGVAVSGKLVEVKAQEVVLSSPDGKTSRVPRSEIASVKATGLPSPESPSAEPASEPPAPSVAANRRERAVAAPGRREPAATPEPPQPSFHEYKLPAGTPLSVELRTPVSSASSEVEEQIRGRLTRAVTVNGSEVIPEGTAVLGTITEVERSGRVKGLARVAFRFILLEYPEAGGRVGIRTAPLVFQAQASKKKDAAKIGGAAAGGAIIGGIVGGGDGAAKGAAIGGAAGTGVVLSTRGEEISLPAGTEVTASLSEPMVVRVRVRVR